MQKKYLHKWKQMTEMKFNLPIGELSTAVKLKVETLKIYLYFGEIFLWTSNKNITYFYNNFYPILLACYKGQLYSSLKS